MAINNPFVNISHMAMSEKQFLLRVMMQIDNKFELTNLVDHIIW